MAGTIWSRSSGADTVSGTGTNAGHPSTGRIRDRLSTGEPQMMGLATKGQFSATVSAISGAGASIQWIVETHWGLGNWVPVWASSLITAPGSVQQKLGHGDSPGSPSAAYRVRWVLAGTTPSVTWSGQILAL